MNKLLDSAEVKVYRKKTRIILGLELCVLVLLMALRISKASGSPHAKAILTTNYVK